VLAGVLALLAGALPGTASAGSCPNEEIRAEQGSERLPDCRAFELVSPEVKGDNSSIGLDGGVAFGFPDGKHVAYTSLSPMPGAQSGLPTHVLSTRTASGWMNTAVAPPVAGPLGFGSLGVLNGVGSMAVTGDFSAAFIKSPFDSDSLDQDGAIDVYRMDLSSAAWSLAALPDTGPMTAGFNPPEPRLAGTYPAGVSENGSHVLFQTLDQLPVAPGTPSEHPADMLYDRTGGRTYMVGVLPNGTVSQTCNAVLGDGAEDADFIDGGELSYGAVSPDGTNVVFKLTGAGGAGAPCGPDDGVYLREDNARTVKLVGRWYVGRSSDGSKIFTVAAGVANGLYEYDVASGTTTTISTEGTFVASSADGARVYYLAAGERLYSWDRGTSTLIPKAGDGFASYLYNPEFTYNFHGNHAVATPDGSKLLFLDTTNLTGYDNFGPTCIEAGGGHHPGLCSEAYVYDAPTGSITCVSCSPTGLPPLGNAEMKGAIQYDGLLPRVSEGEISPDGSRVFFETLDALVPQDTNGLMDVYEWEKGRIYLISSGQGSFGSIFAGASSTGDDVFFMTTDHLAPQDIETSTQIYDARVDGGFSYRPFTTGCNSSQCQGPQTPAPAFGAPASATFVGLGNPGGSESNPPPVKPKALTRAQKLTKALKGCRAKHDRHERLACEKQARRRYGHRSPSTRRPKS
jgi:hypothetical protein